MFLSDTVFSDEVKIDCGKYPNYDWDAFYAFTDIYGRKHWLIIYYVGKKEPRGKFSSVAFALSGSEIVPGVNGGECFFKPKQEIA